MMLMVQFQIESGTTKRDHPQIQKGPVTIKRGQYLFSKKNIYRTEQIGYIDVSLAGFVVGSLIPGLKELRRWPLQLCVLSKVPPWTNRRRWMPRCPRSSAISARA